MKILFVCHGNICRSPMAEFIMKDMLRKNGMDHIAVDSAAVSGEELGCDIYPPAKRKMEREGIPFTHRSARCITAKDGEIYDYIIGMDSSNMHRMARILGPHPRATVCRLMELTPRGGDVADPWYTGDFDRTFDDIVCGCSALLKILKNQG